MRRPSLHSRAPSAFEWGNPYHFNNWLHADVNAAFSRAVRLGKGTQIQVTGVIPATTTKAVIRSGGLQKVNTVEHSGLMAV